MLVLASASPRRQELLRNAGIPFTVCTANISELPHAGESARDLAERLAREKALAVFQQRPNDYVLGADTVVVIDDHILGKPRHEADAMRMLRLLSGRTHQVITGVCLRGPLLQADNQTRGTGFEDVRSETTRVISAITKAGRRPALRCGCQVALNSPLTRTGLRQTEPTTKILLGAEANRSCAARELRTDCALPGEQGLWRLSAVGRDQRTDQDLHPH